MWVFVRKTFFFKKKEIQISVYHRWSEHYFVRYFHFGHSMPFCFVKYFMQFLNDLFVHVVQI